MAGSILLDTILRQIGAVELTLCDLALREGLALDYLSRNRAHIAKVEQFPDVRRRSVVELAERCNYASEHAEQVRRLSLSLFDQTQPAHGLGAREREWLDHAALLHDIGVHISYGRHHKHSYYLIKNGDLRGFEPEEVEVIALVARHHRRGLPKKSRGGYASLPARLRRTVRTLAAMLRLAEGLDRSHAQSVGSFENRARAARLPAAAGARGRHGARALGRAAQRRPPRSDTRPHHPLRGDRRRRPRPRSAPRGSAAGPPPAAGRPVPARPRRAPR